MFIFPEAGGELETASGIHQIPARSFVIAAPGKVDIHLPENGYVYALSTGVTAPAKELAINAAVYEHADHRVKPISTTSTQTSHTHAELRIYQIDDIPFPAENSRLKFLRTHSMSINWVEYEGPRDRTKLSPHAHSDFEQGSLAIAGNFVHHIRTPWIADANQWEEDKHIEAAAESVLVIPPELIHTTEGIGDGRHILIDIFAPARDDFIAKGWVHNAAEYSA